MSINLNHVNNTVTVVDTATNADLSLTPKGSGFANITSGGVKFPDGTTQTTAAAGATAGPAFSAYLSSNQSVTSGTDTKVTLDTEEFDTNSNFASSRFTPTVAGYYQINGGVYLAGTANTQAGGLVYIYKNGSVYKQGSTYLSNTTAGVALVQVVSSIIYFNGSTDYVELWAQNQQTAARFSGGSSLTYFNGCYLRGT
jgi:hypothetical protein